MASKFGERSKEDLLKENEALCATITYLESESDQAQVRLSALNYAQGLSGGGSNTSEKLLADAAAIEAYILGTSASGPDVPVPSPS